MMEQQRTSTATRIGATIFGVIIAGLGLGAAGGGVVAVGRLEDARRASEGGFVLGASLIPFGVLLLLVGGAILWLIARPGAERGRRPATLPPWWLSALAFVVLVAAAWLLLRAGWWWGFFPCAAVAVFLPALATGRLALPPTGPRPPWRRLLPAFAWGALATPILAVTLEGLASAGALGAGLAGLAAGDGAKLALLRTIARQLQGRTLTEAQTQALTRLALGEPLVLLSFGFVLVFVGPVAEELSKFLGVLLFSRARQRGGARRDSVLTIVLIGLASGLGFAVFENIFYAAQAGATGWTALTLTRGAATPLMHGTASALFALGWARQQRQPWGWGLLGGAVAAIVLHGGWNLAAGLLLLVGLVADGPARTVASLALLLILAILASLTASSAGLLVWLRRTLGREVAAGEDGGVAVRLLPSPPAAAGNGGHGQPTTAIPPPFVPVQGD